MCITSAYFWFWAWWCHMTPSLMCFVMWLLTGKKVAFTACGGRHGTAEQKEKSCTIIWFVFDRSFFHLFYFCYTCVCVCVCYIVNKHWVLHTGTEVYPAPIAWIRATAPAALHPCILISSWCGNTWQWVSGNTHLFCFRLLLVMQGIYL